MQAKRKLILSVDYEIFGNGAGDVRQHIVDPTEHMARICDAHAAPLTVFFEVEEYLAFDRFGSQLRDDLGYDPARLIRDQIINLSRRGHDIQLHLHPEWFGARYDRGKWILNPTRQTVDSLFDSTSEACRYIAERKAVIDDLLASAGVSQRVQVYRAGAFSVQPGQKLLAALQSAGFVIDSSVCKGLTRRNGFDYRNAPSAKGPWRVSHDAAVEDASGELWEFPIYSEMGRRWQQLTIGRLKAKFSRNIPKARRDQMIEQLGVKKTPFGLLQFLFQPVPIKLDYHNIAPRKLMQMVERAPCAMNGLPDVLTLIGHSKEHLDDRPLTRFLELMKAKAHLKIASFTEIADLMCGLPAQATLENAGSRQHGT